jgi:hypothetical protein
MVRNTLVRWLDAVAYVALLGLCAAVPFEHRAPVLVAEPGAGLAGVRLSFQPVAGWSDDRAATAQDGEATTAPAGPRYLQIGSLKLHSAIVLGLTTLLMLLRGDWRGVWRLPGFWPTMALLAAFTLSTAAAKWSSAGAFGNSVKFLIRWTLASLLLVATVYLVNTARRRRAMVWAIATGGLCTVLACGCEIFAWESLLEVFDQFRETAHWVDTRVGIFHRLQATFSHPNALAGYAAMALPVALGGVLAARQSGRLSRLGTAAALVAFAVAAGLVVLAMSRAGLSAALLGVATISLIAWTRRELRPGRRCAIAFTAAALSGVLAAAALCTPFLSRLELGPQPLFAPGMQVGLPSHAAAREMMCVPVRVRPATPTQAPVTAIVVDTWRLNNTAGKRRNLRARRAERVLPARIAEDGWIDISVWLDVPRYGGSYHVSWMVAVQGKDWLDPWSLHRTSIETEIAGPPPRRLIRRFDRGIDRPPPASLVTLDVAPKERLVVWRAAWSLFLTHAWLGLGPDNFRLYSASVMGQDQWDPRARTHSLYLETLVNLGIAGFLAFAWFSVDVLILAWRRVFPPGPYGVRYLSLGLAAALCAFYLHGTVDYLLGTTNLLTLFFLTCGVVYAASKRYGRTATRAHATP